MKLNEPGRRKLAKMPEVPQAMKREPLIALGSQLRGPSFLCLQLPMQKCALRTGIYPDITVLSWLTGR